jgi:hypothetical protein
LVPAIIYLYILALLRLTSSFIDEFLPVRIVLRLSDCTETTLKHYLPRLEVKLDVYAVDPAENVAENPTPTREVIFSGLVNTEEEPLVVFNEFEGEDGIGNHVYLIWTTETVLSELKPTVLPQLGTSTQLTSLKSVPATESRIHRFCLWPPQV